MIQPLFGVKLNYFRLRPILKMTLNPDTSYENSDGHPVPPAI